MSHDPTSLRRAHLCFGQTLAVLVLAILFAAALLT